jgi:hypothetical protein
MSETKCLILDEEELERVGSAGVLLAAEPLVPEWRTEGEKLVTSRIFGGNTTSPRQFPTAFHTYRPERVGATTRPFPFQMGKGAAAAAAAAPPTSIVRRTESTSPEPRGSLFKAVRTVFYNSAKEEAPPVPKPTQVLYTPCTPPFAAMEAPPSQDPPPLDASSDSSSEWSKNGLLN